MRRNGNRHLLNNQSHLMLILIYYVQDAEKKICRRTYA